MKKIIFMLVVLLVSGFSGYGQTGKYTTYYYQKASLFEELPIRSSDIVFLGNSLTDGAEWAELFDMPQIKNRGISGDIAQGIYDRLGPILKGKPAKLFLLVGINDLSHQVTADSITRAVGKIIDKLQAETPATRLYLQSLLPVNDQFGMFKSVTDKGDIVLDINRRFVQLAKEKGITYIDLYPHFKNKDNEKLNPELTNDGLHLLGKGYKLWKEIVYPYVVE